MSYEIQKPSDTTHYVARIVVERVDHKTVEVRNGIAGGKTHEVKRTVTELTSLTLKSDSLVGLVEKIGKHTELIDDIDAQDAVKPRGTRGSE